MYSRAALILLYHASFVLMGMWAIESYVEEQVLKFHKLFINVLSYAQCNIQEKPYSRSAAKSLTAKSSV